MSQPRRISPLIRTFPNRRLIKAKDRSRRSKTSEAYLRLKDHLERFPDFYNSEITEPGGKKT
ncbi:TraY domain-containing protein [Raoultella ornithinolytica]|uniref:TraY domain-containing protein n=1 Tax=Raoultella ornithinolytica TaxID=54291 RepID=UPI0019D4EACC|nr:TraY domain-containing protein [Raoultella ornithinolytica]